LCCSRAWVLCIAGEMASRICILVQSDVECTCLYMLHSVCGMHLCLLVLFCCVPASHVHTVITGCSGIILLVLFFRGQDVSEVCASLFSRLLWAARREELEGRARKRVLCASTWPKRRRHHGCDQGGPA